MDLSREQRYLQLPDLKKQEGKRTNKTKMANCKPGPDPTIRYLAVPGRNEESKGKCPRCNGTGIVGKFCFPCCDAADEMIGTCPECEQVGPLARLCEQCGRAEYQDESPGGHCPNCNKDGMRGCPCTDCKGMNMVYEE